jgi:hypothetical protein
MWEIDAGFIIDMTSRVNNLLAQHKTKDEAIETFIRQGRKGILKHLLIRTDITIQQKEVIDSYFLMKELTFNGGNYIG